MKVCIPTKEKGGMEDELSEHFGSAPTFTIIDAETMTVEVVPNKSDHFGGTGKPPEQIERTGAKVVVCRGLGPKAMILLRDYGIEVFVGASGNAKEAFEMWSKGELQKASLKDACQGHIHGHQRG